MASRLIDKLIVKPYLQPHHRELLATTPVIVADNVVRYLLEARQGKNYRRLEQEIASVMPPFPVTFIQFRTEDQLEVGVLVSKIERGDEWELTLVYFTEEQPCIASQVRLLHRGGTLIPKTFLSDSDDMLDFRGDIKREWEKLDDLGLGEEIAYMEIIADWEMVALMTLAFMNCKNAVLEEVEPHENKRRAKHGKLPLMRYHVLKIKPFGNRSDSEGQGSSHASPALHIRRGHFATYTDAAPLFGKYVGTYWKDQMLVGRKSDRVVVKDYEMDLTGAK